MILPNFQQFCCIPSSLVFNKSGLLEVYVVNGSLLELKTLLLVLLRVDMILLNFLCFNFILTTCLIIYKSGLLEVYVVNASLFELKFFQQHKFEWNIIRYLDRQRNIFIDRSIERYIDRQINIKIDRQIDRERDRQIQRQID